MLKKRILLSAVVIAALTFPSIAEEAKTTSMPEAEMAASTEDIDLSEEPEELEEEESDIEISGYLKAEGAVFTKSGSSHNPIKPHSGGDIMKGEGTLKVFVNGSIGEDSSFHAELQAIGDTEGIDGYEYHRNYTQYDALRELYIDTTFADWDFRLGKQQVVWGKADGVKFLDIINPTDFREWGQNTMEDSRIPLWMAVAEKDLGNNDSLQFVWVPDVGRVHQIPGLYNTKTGDQGQPFVSLGADTMTGQYNGFVNIGNDMGRVAGAFDAGFSQAFGIPAGNNILANFTNMTVSQFTNMQDISVLPLPNPLPPISGGQMLDGVIMQTGSTTNLSAGTGQYDYTNAMHMFEYMGDTTFATFNGFVGMKTSYRVDDISRDLQDHNFGVKYAKATDFGLNYTLNYYRHWENNPVVDMRWEGAGGEKLNTKNTVGSFVDPRGNAYKTNTVSLVNTDGSAYVGGPATLVFDQGVNQVNTFGTSFDYAIDTSFAPVVIRGEFVYDQGAKVPEVDLGKLAYGDLVGAMTMADADMFKFVIGADVTVATNLFISLQFMDSWNLDYVDTDVQYDGNSQSYGKFTANPATMSLGNNFKKAQEHQIMYTLFLSKPFLESDAMRVNNLFLYEQEDGGYWNRLDLEYSYADDILFSAEWNQYGGDEYGVFGQFANLSNFQLGVTYLF
ncbi:hypothetical protein [Sulfurovum sp.]|uniref:hypothetical protein n=1 Tax=Sulfurovum sp. TaxID=1969726 RepID=UPI0028681DCC|nr:hypothetical protein [Sulfurovum sp.]